MGESPNQIPEVDHWIQLTYFVYVRTPSMTGSLSKNLCDALAPVARDVISNETETARGT